MIKLIIFDLDGTLVNAYPAVARSVNYTLKVLGLPPRSDQEIKRSVGEGDRQLMVKFVGEKLADRALAIYRPNHAKVLKEKGTVRFLPGVKGVLGFLKSKGYKIAIASNRPNKFTRIILNVLGALDLFNSVLCADRASKPKPHPDMLWAITKRLGFDQAQALYVGDMTIDVRCAHAAGIRMVAVHTGSSSKKELKSLKPWRIISKMTQLKAIMSSFPVCGEG
ncbi:MAG: HAD family hydrolase [Candidatus Omnitrophica bacterium]|nr:HAD family hydrolase [Candidatus Omnitrophota bacterium]